MTQDKTYICRDCQRQIRTKAVSQGLVDLKLCSQCYTRRLTNNTVKEE